MAKWYENLDFGPAGAMGEYSPPNDSAMTTQLFKWTLSQGIPMLEKSGMHWSRLTRQEALEGMEALGLTHIHSDLSDENHCFVGDSTYATIFKNSGHEHWRWHLRTTDMGLVERVEAWFNAFNTDPPRPQVGTVFALAYDGTSFSFSAIGNAGHPLIWSNYEPEVVVGVGHILEDIQNADPCGRLSIFEGETGTGKTHLLRGMMNEMHNCTVVLVPPHLMQELGSPTLLPALVRLSSNRSDKERIVFILEDADYCLVPREKDTLSSISSLLNLSDGILGHLLDLRILVTTNAKIVEVDPAIQREGRLCRHLHVGLLHKKQAGIAFESLTGTKKNFRQATSLAHVYQLARQVKPPEKKNGVRVEMVLGE